MTDLDELERRAKAANSAAPLGWTTGPETAAGAVWLYSGPCPLAEPVSCNGVKEFINSVFRLRRDAFEKRHWESQDEYQKRYYAQTESIAKHLAACQPQTILALIAELRTLREALSLITNEDQLVAIWDIANKAPRCDKGSAEMIRNLWWCIWSPPRVAIFYVMGSKPMRWMRGPKEAFKLAQTAFDQCTKREQEFIVWRDPIFKEFQK